MGAIKPQLKCTQFAKFKAEYEEKMAIATAGIDKARVDCAKVVKDHEKLMNEKNELMLALQSGGSAVQDIIDKTNRVEAMKNDLQKQVDDMNRRVKAEKDLETNLTNNEDDKTTKDNQIRTLREELAHQEDMVAKLNKEEVQETQNKRLKKIFKPQKINAIT